MDNVNNEARTNHLTGDNANNEPRSYDLLGDNANNENTGDSAKSEDSADKDTSRYDLPGGHIYDGLQLFVAFPAHIMDRVNTFSFHDQDILVVSFPKSGSTWMQEILYLTFTEGDFASATTRHVDLRVPHLEIARPGELPRIDILQYQEPPRLIKSNLPHKTLANALEGKKTKIIVVMRNVKDTIVSYYHFYKMSHMFGFKGGWNDFYELFKEERVVCGSWFDHVLGWWKLREEENVKFYMYEDMKTDLTGTIRSLASFVGKELTSEKVDKIALHCSFNAMKQNPNVNRIGKLYKAHESSFIRKGVTGDWKNHFTDEQNEDIDKRIEERLARSGLKFKYVL